MSNPQKDTGKTPRRIDRILIIFFLSLEMEKLLMYLPTHIVSDFCI